MKSSILVVARDADCRAMLARRLMGAGYAVELSEEPGRARELAQAGGVRLAVLAPGDFGAAGAIWRGSCATAWARSSSLTAATRTPSTSWSA